ncbi:hypothetical protein [Nostoc sp. DedQUE07]|uniref:hypothetical protein n=1 Tax=Nostoc sp. DedQUE07 TaxID=3075392 RepID=UPI00391C53FD
MSNLEQISESSNRKKPVQNDHDTEQHNHQAEQIAKNLQDLGNEVDNIVANFIAREETQVLGASEQGSELRDISAEDFVRSFIQKGGQ